MLVIYGNLFFWDMMIDHKKKDGGVDWFSQDI